MEVTRELLVKAYNEAVVAFEKLKSITVELIEREDKLPYICFKCIRYRHGDNRTTRGQADYIKRLSDFQSSYNLNFLNKFAASAIITFIKNHDYCKEFYFTVS